VNQGGADATLTGIYIAWPQLPASIKLTRAVSSLSGTLFSGNDASGARLIGLNETLAAGGSVTFTFTFSTSFGGSVTVDQFTTNLTTNLTNCSGGTKGY
jgi:hypothetical protein